MNTSTVWTVILAGPARKSLRRIPVADREGIHAALREMTIDPFRGDIKYLKGQKAMLRRRVGDWAILSRLMNFPVAFLYDH